MQTGKRDEVIELFSLLEQNVGGELQKTWVSQGNDWAEIIPVKGQESFEAARQNARAFIRLNLRYRDDVTEKWRLEWDGDSYNIFYIDRTDRRKGEIWITAELVGAGDRDSPSSINASVHYGADSVINNLDNVVVPL